LGRWKGDVVASDAKGHAARLASAPLITGWVRVVSHGGLLIDPKRIEFCQRVGSDLSCPTASPSPAAGGPSRGDGGVEDAATMPIVIDGTHKATAPSELGGPGHIPIGDHDARSLDEALAAPASHLS